MNSTHFSQSPSLDSQALYLPDNASLFTRVRVALRALKVLCGDRGTVAGQLVNDRLDRSVYASLVSKLQGSEEGAACCPSDPRCRAGPELERARRSAAGISAMSLRYFLDNKLSPFRTTIVLKNDIDFIAKSYRETHDLLHVLTGYDTDVIGELELQAYALGNLNPHRGAHPAGRHAQSAQNRQAGVELPSYARRLWAAYRRGRASRQFLGFWFEHHWETPSPHCARGFALVLSG